VFGYVKPDIPNLRVKEYDFYKSVYCGLCRSMKKHTGGLSRVTLSFDMTFFALVRMSLARTDVSVRRRRCFLHPLRKRPMMDDNAALAYTADVSAVLTYYKLEDTIADEKGWKRFCARVLRPFAFRIKRRAVRSLREISDIVEGALRKLSSLEAENCGIPDMPADVFGDMLGKLLAYGLSGAEAKIAYEIGLHTGRWVYLTDAIFDLEDDRRSGSYNPFLRSFPEENALALMRDSALRGVMAMESASIMRAVDLIDFSDRSVLRSCIENIVCDGMENSVSMALGKERTDGERSLQGPRY
jgi:hypothetical protein